MLSAVLCAAVASVYGVFAGGGKKSGVRCQRRTCACGHCGPGERYVETARSAVVTEMTTGRVLLEKSRRGGVSAVTV